MYEIGSLIVYGTTGVCRVEAISDPPVRGMDAGTKYYRLKPLFQTGSIFCPVNNTRVRVRPVITREEAETLLEKLPDLKSGEYCTGSSAQLASQYQEILGRCSPEDLAQLVVSLYSKKQYLASQRRKFGQVDDHYMKQARSLLHGELSIALEIPVSEVEERISLYFAQDGAEA